MAGTAGGEGGGRYAAFYNQNTCCRKTTARVCLFGRPLSWLHFSVRRRCVWRVEEENTKRKDGGALGKERLLSFVLRAGRRDVTAEIEGELAWAPSGIVWSECFIGENNGASL